MDAIYIPFLLQAPEKTEEISVHSTIRGLDTLTPVRGILRVTHQKTYLQVTATVETIVTLTCHRCLQNYNHRLQVNTTELIWLENPTEEMLPLEREVKLEDLSETLSPNGYFDPESWLYEQLSLAMPLQQICGADCAGPNTASVEPQPKIDHRWAGLEALKQQLSLNQD